MEKFVWIGNALMVQQLLNGHPLQPLQQQHLELQQHLKLQQHLFQLVYTQPQLHTQPQQHIQHQQSLSHTLRVILVWQEMDVPPHPGMRTL